MSYRRMKRRFQKLTIYLLCVAMTLPTAMGASPGGDRRTWGFTPAPEPTPVEELAKKIDKLEKHIDQNGSVAIKTPDVWGESRLMSHRSDIENQLKARLNRFEVRTNAKRSTKDAALLSGALSIRSQIDGTPLTDAQQASLQDSASTLETNVNLNDSKILPRTGFATSFTATSQLEPVVELEQLHRYLQHLNQLRRLNEGDDNSDAPGYALNLIRIPVSVLPGRRTERGYGAEVEITVDPYISDEILPLAWRDFVINGVRERISFEVFEIASQSSIADLRTALKKFDVCLRFNAVSENTSRSPAPAKTRLASVSRSIPDAASLQAAKKTVEDVAEHRRSDLVKALLALGETDDFEKVEQQLAGLSINRGIRKVITELAKEDKDQLRELVRQAQLIDEVSMVAIKANVSQSDLSIAPSYSEPVNALTVTRLAVHAYEKLVTNEVRPIRSVSDDDTDRNDENILANTLAAAAAQLRNEEAELEPKDRLDAGLTMPSVERLMKAELAAAYEFLDQDRTRYLWTRYCTPELSRLIREHRIQPPGAQLKCLESDFNQGFANGEQAQTPSHVFVDPSVSIEQYRSGFFDEIMGHFPQAIGSVTASLAWQIIVESALLNERLNQDMKETASLRNCPCVNVGWLPLFGPEPPMEARAAFKEYVKCRWPIRVFALDPVTQDQNVSDSFNRRREMQMVAAVAASNRVIGGQGLARFARRMEYDLETLELNRTAISFSHGDNTFGWRFYPRVQAPPVPGTLTAVTRDLLLGAPTRDSDLLKRKLEPGTRECTALVVMPSFVPQVMVDVRTNWFRLASHKPLLKFMHREPGYQDTMELSREVVSMKRLAQRCSADAHLYRNGEVYRLCKAIERLDHRLPLQTHMIPVPWENELGGFSIFRKGGGALEPELQGWYGGPGVVVTGDSRSRNSLVLMLEAERRLANEQLKLSTIPAGATYKTARDAQAAIVDAAQKNLEATRTSHATVLAANTSTTVFLVGKNFSVLNASIIAGGVDVTNTIQVINRRLLSVRIPSNASTMTPAGFSQPQVVVHLATPHGASSRQLIPAIDAAALTAKAESEAIKEVKATADAAKKLAQSLAARQPSTFHWGATAADVKVDVEVKPAPCLKAGSKAGLKAGTKATFKCFCPKARGQIGLAIEEGSSDSPWPSIDKPTPQIGSPSATGELAVYVAIPGEAKKKAISLGAIKNGSFSGSSAMTAEQLFVKILPEISDNLPCSSAEPVSIVVEGFMRFNPSQPVIKLENTVTYSITLETPSP